MRTMMALVLGVCFLAGCDKPTEADCKKAVDNLNQIYGAHDDDDALADGVRHCQAMSTKATVQCMIAAKTIEDADKCEGKNPGKKTPPPATPAPDDKK
jgi:hypothetical protein